MSKKPNTIDLCFTTLLETKQVKRKPTVAERACAEMHCRSCHGVALKLAHSVLDHAKLWTDIMAALMNEVSLHPVLLNVMYTAVITPREWRDPMPELGEGHDKDAKLGLDEVQRKDLVVSYAKDFKKLIGHTMVTGRRFYKLLTKSMLRQYPGEKACVRCGEFYQACVTEIKRMTNIVSASWGWFDETCDELIARYPRGGVYLLRSDYADSLGKTETEKKMVAYTKDHFFPYASGGKDLTSLSGLSIVVKDGVTAEVTDPSSGVIKYKYHVIGNPLGVDVKRYGKISAFIVMPK